MKTQNKNTKTNATVNNVNLVAQAKKETKKVSKQNEISINDVRSLNDKLKSKLKTLGGCISLILTLDKNETEKQETKIIDFLVSAKKDKDIYQKLANTVKPHAKSGNYNKYAVLLAVKKLINE